MTIREQVREEIARVIDKALNGDCGYGVGEHLADVLVARFPVLGGVTDEMVERGAIGLFDHDGFAPDEWKFAEALGVFHDSARAVLDAARGDDRDGQTERSET